MKKNLPYIFFFFSIILSTFLWENINIPFNQLNAISGDSYSINKHHPKNDIIRFLTFLSIPFLTLIFCLQRQKKIFFLNLLRVVENKNKDSFLLNKNLKIFFWLTIFAVFLEFCFLNFASFNYNLDIFHEGLWLTASQNAKISGDFWLSSYIGRGFFGNFYPYFLEKFLSLDTIGATRLFNLIIVLLNKILLLFIALKIVSVAHIEDSKKIIYYFLLSISFLIFTSYGSPIFFLRSFILLLFTLFLLNFFITNNSKNISLIFISLLSSLSFFWYIDIAVYVNIILFFLVIYFILKKEFKYLAINLISILLGWFLIIISFPKIELLEFIENTKLIITTIDYIHGLIYPTPFLSLDMRSTKALVFFLFTGFFIIYEVNKGDNKNFTFLFMLIILFLTSIVYFNYGLSRSDSGHIRIASSFLYLPLFSIIYYKLLNLKIRIFEKKLFTNHFLLMVIFFIVISINKKYEDKNFKNLPLVKANIEKLINYPDMEFISKDYLDFLTYFKQLSKEDECVMVFSNEVALPYLLKKQTCSKYYLMYTATPKIIQNNIIKDLVSKKPEYLIYASDIDIYGNNKLRLNLINSFIEDNYTFNSKFSHWEIYKRND